MNLSVRNGGNRKQSRRCGKMNPSKDSTEGIVRSFGDLTYRVQPQISAVGGTRYPSATRTPNITWVKVLNVHMPLEHCKPARIVQLHSLLPPKAGALTRPQL